MPLAAPPTMGRRRGQAADEAMGKGAMRRRGIGSARDSAFCEPSRRCPVDPAVSPEGNRRRRGCAGGVAGWGHRPAVSVVAASPSGKRAASAPCSCLLDTCPHRPTAVFRSGRTQARLVRPRNQSRMTLQVELASKIEVFRRHEAACAVGIGRCFKQELQESVCSRRICVRPICFRDSDF